MCWECARVGDYIYLFGCDESFYSAYRYNIKTTNFEQLTDTPIITRRAGVQAVGTDIYIIGGGENRNANKTIYKYDTLTDTYTYMNALKQQFTLGSTILIDTDIYFFGGFSNETYDQNISAYKYNTISNTLTQLADIPFTFAYGRITEYNGDIYLFGGYLNPKIAYKYNIQTNSYTEITNIPFDFILGNLERVGTKVYLFQNTDVCIYDIKTNTYTTNLNYSPYTFDSVCSMSIDTENEIQFLFFGHKLTGDWSTEIVCYSLEKEIFDGATVIFFEENADKSAQIYNDELVQGKMLYNFRDLALYTINTGYEVDLKRYYGNGTKWIEIE